MQVNRDYLRYIVPARTSSETLYPRGGSGLCLWRPNRWIGL